MFHIFPRHTCGVFTVHLLDMYCTVAMMRSFDQCEKGGPGLSETILRSLDNRIEYCTVLLLLHRISYL